MPGQASRLREVREENQRRPGRLAVTSDLTAADPHRQSKTNY